jgi:hypothetical protein
MITWDFVFVVSFIRRKGLTRFVGSVTLFKSSSPVLFYKIASYVFFVITLTSCKSFAGSPVVLFKIAYITQQKKYSLKNNNHLASGFIL